MLTFGFLLWSLFYQPMDENAPLRPQALQTRMLLLRPGMTKDQALTVLGVGKRLPVGLFSSADRYYYTYAVDADYTLHMSIRGEGCLLRYAWLSKGQTVIAEFTAK